MQKVVQHLHRYSLVYYVAVLFVFILASVLLNTGCDIPAEKGTSAITIKVPLNNDVYYVHDKEHEVGIWIHTNGIFILPDREYNAPVD